ncbi:type II secretion system protein [Candidatus Microgenomates bacterium]|nr:MAG: type II secretion system protein [Candidatus Microgenomates bacterium]
MTAIKKGFTLVELLIVIAILGTLAVVVLIALNPVQQLARTRDSGRSSTIAQLGHAMEAYATARGGQYPLAAACPNGSWITTCLMGSGEISNVPAAVPFSTGVTNRCGGENGFCYASTATSAVLYTSAEAQTNTSQCTGATPQAYFVFSTAAGRGGLWCGANAPTPGVTTGFTQ